jgi:MerR family Zn(II)-responsive transcriptional regulator of zntA
LTCPGAGSYPCSDAVSQPQDDGSRADAHDESALLTTGEMARRSNNTLRTVRFYEEEGILRPVRRTEGGHRLFDRSELERLMLVSDLRTAGLSLDEIKQLLELKRRAPTGSDAAKQATEILARRIAELKEKLAVLARLQQDLTDAADIMTGCFDCHESTVTTECGACNVIVSRPTLPRSLRVMWSTQGGRPGDGEG